MPIYYLPTYLIVALQVSQHLAFSGEALFLTCIYISFFYCLALHAFYFCVRF